MAYYVSVIDGPRAVLALGPYNTHGAALANVPRVREYVKANYRDACWYGYGTSRHKTSRQPGKLNDQVGWTADSRP